jgi:nitrogen regulatory protein PII
MKMVVAYVEDAAMASIGADLVSLPVRSLAVLDAGGWDRADTVTLRYRGATLTRPLARKVKLECVVADDRVASVVEVVVRHTNRRTPVDEAVFVVPLEPASATVAAVPIGEVGLAAAG